MWNDFSQQTSITQGGQEFKGRYASTDQSERTQFGDTTFHQGPVGLSSKTTGGVDMDFTREPNGNLNSFRTESASRSESTYYYLTDAIGTTRAVVDDQGAKVNTYDYSPRGVTRTMSEKVPQPFRFAGSYQDPTGLYHNEARYLDPRTGRFTQPDPSGLETNPYLYASGDPTNIIGPNGLIGCPGWAKSACRKVGSGVSKAKEVTAKSAIGLAMLARSFGEDKPGCRNAIYTGAAGLSGMNSARWSGPAAVPVFAAGGFTYMAGLEGAKDSC